jgi:hypothetical protein
MLILYQATSSFPMKPFDLELWYSNIPEAPKEAQLMRDKCSSQFDALNLVWVSDKYLVIAASRFAIVSYLPCQKWF